MHIGSFAPENVRTVGDLRLPEYDPKPYLPTGLYAVMTVNCPVCNKNGEGTGHIVRFVGTDGSYAVWETICPVCDGTRTVAPRPDSTGLDRMNETSEVMCLECGNRRKVLVPGDRSPTGKPVEAACSVCSVSEIVF